VRRLVALSLALLLLGCGEPLQIASQTPRPTRTPLVAQTAGAAPTQRASATTAAGDTAASSTVAPVASATPAATIAATEAPTLRPSVVIIPATVAPRSSLDRWRAQQAEREVLDPAVTYLVSQPVPLLWWDPATGQTLEIGLIAGEVPAQARFMFRPSGAPAIEVAYTINQSYGLTAISAAVRNRMAAAGFTETVETFVVITGGVEPRL
jgi:hypothetical protein